VFMACLISKSNVTSLTRYLNVKLIFVRADVDEGHVGRGVVVVAVGKVSPRDVVVAEEVYFGQLAVD